MVAAVRPLTASVGLAPVLALEGFHTTINPGVKAVAAGESVASIGKRYGLTMASLMAANRLEKPEAAEGDRLIIPVGLRAEAAERMSKAVRQHAPVRHTAAINPAKRSSTAPKTHANPPLVARTAAQ